MSLTVVKGLQSEIFVPITPEVVWTPLEKELKDMRVAFITAAGVHLKTDKRFNLSGDTSFREIPGDAGIDELMVSHGGYDNSDVNRDINCMFPIDRMRELASEGFIKEFSPVNFGFMGGGGDVSAFKESTAPEIAKRLKEAGVDGVVLTAGWGTCHRSAVIVQRAIERIGIATVIIAALPPVVRQSGAPRVVAPRVPMGANAGEPNNKEMQTGIVKGALRALVEIETAGRIVNLPYEYRAKV